MFVLRITRTERVEITHVFVGWLGDFPLQGPVSITPIDKPVSGLGPARERFLYQVDDWFQGERSTKKPRLFLLDAMNTEKVTLLG